MDSFLPTSPLLIPNETRNKSSNVCKGSSVTSVFDTQQNIKIKGRNGHHDHKKQYSGRRGYQDIADPENNQDGMDLGAFVQKGR